MLGRDLIDIHAHFFTDDYRAAMRTAGLRNVDGFPIPDWSVESALDLMDQWGIKTAMLSTPEYVAISAMESMFDPSVYKTDTIKVPVLAVLAKSPFWPPDTETFLRSLAPNLQYVEWDGVSHFLMMEKPVEFDQTVEGFVAKNKLLSK